MQIGKHLKDLRTSISKSQKEIAELGGFSQGLYTKWENDMSLPSAENLTKLAECFECSVDYILGRESEDGMIILGGSNLNESERTIISAYRKLSAKNQTLALGYLIGLFESQN